MVSAEINDIGNDQEIETTPALSLWLARWQTSVELLPFHLVAEQTPDGLSLLGWPDALDENAAITHAATQKILVFIEPDQILETA